MLRLLRCVEGSDVGTTLLSTLRPIREQAYQHPVANDYRTNRERLAYRPRF